MSLSLRSTPESTPRFDALDYALYLRRHVLVIALSCAIAIACAIIAGLAMPNQYTSTASILIEPPAGTDPRTFTAISPIYLESLRTYETFAASDTLFQQALEKFNLRASLGNRSIEAIKSRVLKVTKLRDTKILQISVTLQDAKQAQAVARFLAEETVQLISSASRSSGSDLIGDLQRQAAEAKSRMEQAQAALAAANTRHPVITLRTELDSLIELLYRMRRELYEAEGSAAQYETEGAKARVTLLSTRVRELDQAVAAKSKILADASSQFDRLESERRTTQATYEAAVKRMQEMNSWVGSSGERLRVIDPGIVPERPSAPRVGLYAGVACALALIGSIVYLSLQYGLRI